jgi:hypothetical protein
VGVLPDAPIYGHVVKPEQQRVQTQNLAALGVQFPSCPPFLGDWLQRELADPGDLKSPSLPGASPGSPTGVWLIGNSRPVRLKIEQPWECKSPHADQFGMSTRRASRTCLLNSGLPERGVWCESTAFRHSCARSSKRAGGLIPRIALDQCRVPERYRTRVPIYPHSSKQGAGAS